MDDIETRKMREAIYAKAHTMICDAFHDAGCAIPDPDHDADVNQLNAALGNLEQSITAALIEAADTIRSLREAVQIEREQIDKFIKQLLSDEELHANIPDDCRTPLDGYREACNDIACAVRARGKP